MANRPEIDPTSTLLIVINAAAGSSDAQTKQAAIGTAIDAAGRKAEFLCAGPEDLPQVAREAAAKAVATRAALVAVGGDGTINTVAQAAHAQGCAMGVLAQGTFNYFARSHGLPTEPAEAVQALLSAVPRPVQVGLINDRVFLVNASLGLYPDLLEDRESWKARLGRSRFVAFAAVAATLLRERKQLHLQIERGGVTRDVRTPTLFVGNNRLQLEQVGVAEAPALDAGCMAAVMLRPIGTRSMLWLLLRGAFGSLGDAENVDSFVFQRMVVTPRPSRVARGPRTLKVAFDGEVQRMNPPLAFSVSPEPLWLLKPEPGGGSP